MTLNHIAFIMDGNGRWAQKRGLPRNAGHRKGAEVLLDVVKKAKELGVKYLTFYAFSTENWKRSPEEINGLMNLLREYFDKNFKELARQNVSIRFIGERYMLDADIVERIRNIEESTSQNKEMVLQIALSYGSRQEIIHAVREVAQKVKDGDMSLKDIDERYFSDMLYTKDVPDPDLLIRTSGEQRLSNYLLWQLAYTEFFFTNTLWPDFKKEELESIVENYKTRERRYGKA